MGGSQLDTGGTEACPPDDELAAYVDGRLDRPAQIAVRRHLLTCDACAEVVAEYANAWSMSPGEASSATDNSTSADEPRPLPRTLDRYSVRGRVGVGGMGEVLVADDPVLGRRVAIKRLFAPDRASLLREASFAARLEHPNIVQIFDVVQSGNEALIVMEFIDGAPLDRWLRQPRSPEELLDVFRQAALGLAAAHDAGVIHRDFKPHNVLVGIDGRVRISDFGMARDKGDQHPGTGGTRIYAAPEQRLGAEADAASDQYSFCCALLEGLVGRRPPDGKRWTELLTELPDVWTGRARTRITRALQRGLSLRVASRWPSMQALVEALPSTEANRRRRFHIAAAAVIGIGILAIGTFGTSRRAHRATAGFADSPKVASTIAAQELEQGRALLQTDDLPSALPHLELARRAATVGGDDVVAADASLTLVVLAVNSQDREGAARELRHAEAAVERLAGDRSRRARLLSLQAAALMLEGRNDEAVERALEAKATLASVPSDDPHRPGIAQILASTLIRAGRPQDGIEVAQRQLAERDPNLPETSRLPIMRTLAIGYFGLEQYDPAMAIARERVHIAQRHLGPDALATHRAWAFLGNALDEADQDDKAEQVLSVAVEGLSQHLDPNNSYLAHHRALLADLQRGRGDIEPAVGNLYAAVEAQRMSLPPGHPNLSFTRQALASALFEWGQHAEAVAMAWKATDVRGSSVLASSYDTLGNIYEAQGEAELSMMHFHLAAILAATTPDRPGRRAEYMNHARRVSGYAPS